MKMIRAILSVKTPVGLLGAIARTHLSSLRHG